MGQPVNFGALADSLGFLLRLAQIDAFDRFLASGLPAEARIGEITLLDLVRLNPGIRQGVLAKALRIKRAHMTKLVQALETRGLVQTEVPPEDRRALSLELTQAGEAWAAKHMPSVAKGERATPGALTKKEADDLRRLLRKYLGLHDIQPARKDLA